MVNGLGLGGVLKLAANMTISELIYRATKAHREAMQTSTPFRIGQVYFNVLDDMDPGLADSIVDTNVDPFYDDTKLEAFIAHVKTAWGNAQEEVK